MKYAFIILIITLTGCASRKINDTHILTNDWTDAYKTHVFCGCITEGYSDTIIRQIRKKDPIVVYDELTPIVLDRAYLLGKKVVGDLPQVVLPFEDEDGKTNVKKKFILSACLKYYSSLELDSIANAEYKKFISLKE
ncbi:hypothetical protein FMM05_04625 [Flavobacterium zepuense]|uniref:Lipoprotein n=1 Tax=Flavobacterium zepuense TaxID=2593302 RepID=A0A552V872_9FLAO|nr:hypothetical protein [Flavobacterium zepuense]TRW26667.1 hypothetical protein FMM05_04625 [Flavobacterium zepuense]